MSERRFSHRERAVSLAAGALLCATGLGGWAFWMAKVYAEAPILAFGQVAPQLERLSLLFAAYFAVGALLLLLTLRLGWLAGREILSGRRKREAERLVEN